MRSDAKKAKETLTGQAQSKLSVVTVQLSYIIQVEAE